MTRTYTICTVMMYGKGNIDACKIITSINLYQPIFLVSLKTTLPVETKPFNYLRVIRNVIDGGVTRYDTLA